MGVKFASQSYLQDFNQKKKRIVESTINKKTQNVKKNKFFVCFSLKMKKFPQMTLWIKLWSKNSQNFFVVNLHGIRLGLVYCFVFGRCWSIQFELSAHQLVWSASVELTIGSFGSSPWCEGGMPSRSRSSWDIAAWFG